MPGDGDSDKTAEDYTTIGDTGYEETANDYTMNGDGDSEKTTENCTTNGDKGCEETAKDYTMNGDRGSEKTAEGYTDYAKLENEDHEEKMEEISEEIQSQKCMWLRHLKLDFKAKKSEGKSRAHHQAQYRQRLRDDPEKWNNYKEKQNQRVKEWRQRQSADKRAIELEKNRLRSKRRRQAEKEFKGNTEKPPRSKLPNGSADTRSPEEEVERIREYWREKQQKRRLTLTSEQQEKQRLKRRERYWTKKLGELPSSSACMDTDLSEPLSSEETENVLNKLESILHKNSKTLLYILKSLVQRSTPRQKKKFFEALNKSFKADEHL